MNVPSIKHLFRKVCSALFLPAFLLPALSQTPYFQQETHYRISAVLDDEHHLLNSHISINYINRSPDTLAGIWFHLWPNAFSGRQTAYVRQALRMKNSRLYFAPEEDLGGLLGLDFRADGQPVGFRTEPTDPDIAYLTLPRPLAPGDSVLIETPFILNIPASFSRLGHVDQSYQMTQWYPKPAVYDRKGWHPMPYLDMGEFYSEFGSFDVRITLPKDYAVAATGVLAEESAENDTVKTLRYTADRVHDFAWFADKRFIVEHEEVVLPSGRTVDAWAYYTPEQAGLWKNAAGYVARAVEFYSAHVGEYPWPHATAVEGALSAGAGMEYPMITIIGDAEDAKSLDEVIAHEVGHNWFYGILATNERDHPWMDEGLNSYYENRYMRVRYGSGAAFLDIPALLRGASEISIEEASFLLQARRRLDQAPDTHSDDFGALNYYLGAYLKPPIALRMLEEQIGAEALDNAIQTYYREWQFRHPYPEDFHAVMERETGRNLDWLFDGLLFSNKRVDYSIKKSRKPGDEYTVTVKNRGEVDGPLLLSGMRGDSVLESRLYEGFFGEKELLFPAGDYDRISIDARRLTPEVFRHNNHWRTSGLLRRVEPPRIRLFPSPEDDRHTTLYVLPALANNAYDRNMFGLLLFNSTLPERRLEFLLAPMYATGTKSLAGTGSLQYHLYPAGQFLHGIHLGVGGRMFHFDRNEGLDYDLQFARLTPFIRLEFAKPANSTLFRSFQWRSLLIRRQAPVFSPDGGLFEGIQNNHQVIQEWSYTAEHRRTVNPRSLWVALEQQKREEFPVDADYWKASLEWKSAFTYDKNRHIRFRFFAGGFITNSRRNRGAIFPEAFNLAAQGFNDYRFDDYYFGRMEQTGLWSQQVSLREGGMKALTGRGFPLGRSNNFMLAANLSADLPRRFFLPLKPYFDIGYFDNAMPTGQNDRFADQLLWSGGISIEIGKGALGIYLPLINSQNLGNRLAERGNYLQRIAFAFDLNRLNPYDLVNRAVY